MYIYIYIYMQMYPSLYISLSISLSLSIYIYISLSIYIYMYTHIQHASPDMAPLLSCARDCLVEAAGLDRTMRSISEISSCFC